MVFFSKRKQKSTDWNLKSLVGYLPPWHSSTDTMSPRPGMRFFSGASRLGEIQWYGWDDFPVTFRFQQLLFREPSMHPLIHSYMAMHRICGWLWVLVVWSSRRIWSKATHQRQTGHKVGSSSTWMERSHQIMWYILQCYIRRVIWVHTNPSSIYSLLQKTLTFHKLHASTTTAPSAPSSHQPQSACPVTVQLFRFVNSPLTNGSWWLKKGRFRNWIFFVERYSYSNTVFDNWLVGYLPPQKKKITPSPGPPRMWLLVRVMSDS